MDPSLQARLAEIVDRMLAQTHPDAAGAEPVLRRHIFELRDALDSLRLTVKYLAFDLEATRRENALLRRELEQRPGGGNSGRS
ncbi:MAG: hypothetical protein KF724_05865 [Phycisphaeraceae bacterium]|nr:hypothetical protein [Phycisphaeraceae bacterium]